MRLLMISNSTNPGEAYLDYPKYEIRDFLGSSRNIVFLPYAAVSFGYDVYEEKVNARFREIGLEVESLHRFEDPVSALASADAIVVGGGNTFALLKAIQEMKLTEIIREKVKNGTPYLGWSAGSNLCCPTICTTNDMPIVQPLSFEAFAFVPFQINPHYLDVHPQDHGGETREQRIEEYLCANRSRYVLGLREACMLYYEDGVLRLKGKRSMRVFRYGESPREMHEGEDLQFVLR